MLVEVGRVSVRSGSVINALIRYSARVGTSLSTGLTTAFSTGQGVNISGSSVEFFVPLYDDFCYMRY